MSLNNTVLANLIKTELGKKGFNITETGSKGANDWLNDFCDAISIAVVEHITSAAEVTTDSGAPDGEHHGTVF